jgi:hypothetical protein
MKQDFVVKATTRAGKFLTAGLLALSVSFGANAGSNDNSFSAPTTVSDSQDQEEILYPGTLEKHQYNGQKGCVAIREDTPLVMGLIAKLEGLTAVGSLSFVQTLKDGVHAISMKYSASGDYAYILANKAEGAFCISEKLHDLSFQSAGHYQAINLVQSTAHTSE